MESVESDYLKAFVTQQVGELKEQITALTDVITDLSSGMPQNQKSTKGRKELGSEADEQETKAAKSKNETMVMKENNNRKTQIPTVE